VVCSCVCRCRMTGMVFGENYLHVLIWLVVLTKKNLKSITKREFLETIMRPIKDIWWQPHVQHTIRYSLAPSVRVLCTTPCSYSASQRQNRCRAILIHCHQSRTWLSNQEVAKFISLSKATRISICQPWKTEHIMSVYILAGGWWHVGPGESPSRATGIGRRF
jgi:hypothetical protein